MGWILVDAGSGPEGDWRRHCIFMVAMASWLEKKIHKYEEMRWAQEPNRRNLPFGWGLEHADANGDVAHARDYFAKYAAEAIRASENWYDGAPANDYALTDGVLTFTSRIVSPWRENNCVHAQVFAARARRLTPRAAVVVLSQWNSKWHEQQNVCRWLQRLGMTAVKMSLPYHDRRSIPDHPRADHMVGPNVGLTMQAARQAVVDVRSTLRWLEQQGYERLGILGTSIGSAIGFIAMCHEPAIRAAAYLHASTYFGDVVARGLTTKNVWEPMRDAGITIEDLRAFWLPISPFPYISKLQGGEKRILLITGRYDPTFLPDLTETLIAKLRQELIEFERLSLPCGHYSLGVTPFSQIAGYRFGKFLQRALTK